jgi:hypothetical protein
MQFAITLASTILAFALGTSAIPSPQVVLHISNDLTGANAQASIPADNVPHSIAQLFHGTAVDTDQHIIGTSAQLNTFSDSIKCTLTSTTIPGWVYEFDGRAHNFVDLDGQTAVTIPIWLENFNFQCTLAPLL